MIEWGEIDLKGKTSGTTKTLCPACSHTRKKKKDPCLSVNIDKGAAKCWNCGEVSWRDQGGQNTVQNKTYTVPPQQWQNHTALSDGLVKWFAQGRKISQNTLIKMRISEERAYIPARGREMNCISFNYFHNGKLVNKKYRSGDKNFTQIAGAKKVFYNIDNAIDHDDVFIVEGEMDCLAMVEAGYENTISVPNGANDLNDIFETCERELNSFKRFYIAVDTDQPGRSLEEELVKRLGKAQCFKVPLRAKDPNDAHIAGSLDKSIEDAEPYPIDGTFTAKDVSKEIDDLYTNGLQRPVVPKSPIFRVINEVFSALKGQLTVVTGIPSNGKSTFVEWYLLNLINDNDLKLSMYSPEHFPMQLHHSYLAEKVIGKPFYNDTSESLRMTREELNRYKAWSKDRVYLTYPEEGGMPSWEWLLKKFREQIFRFGVDVFLIDAFNKVKRRDNDSVGDIGQILGELTLFAQTHGVMIFLVAHPTKMGKREDGSFYVPTLYDVKGSGDFYDQTHNGFVIHRERELTMFRTLKLKFKHQAVSDKDVYLQFVKSNGRFVPMDFPKNFESLIGGESKDFKQMLIGGGSDFLDGLPKRLNDDEVPF